MSALPATRQATDATAIGRREPSRLGTKFTRRLAQRQAARRPRERETGNGRGSGLGDVAAIYAEPPRGNAVRTCGGVVGAVYRYILFCCQNVVAVGRSAWPRGGEQKGELTPLHGVAGRRKGGCGGAGVAGRLQEEQLVEAVRWKQTDVSQDADASLSPSRLRGESGAKLIQKSPNAVKASTQRPSLIFVKSRSFSFSSLCLRQPSRSSAPLTPLHALVHTLRGFPGGRVWGMDFMGPATTRQRRSCGTPLVPRPLMTAVSVWRSRGHHSRPSGS
jgi:hypothetical protein